MLKEAQNNKRIEYIHYLSHDEKGGSLHFCPRRAVLIAVALCMHDLRCNYYNNSFSVHYKSRNDGTFTAYKLD